MWKKLLIILLAFFIFVPQVRADEVDDLEKRISELKQNLANTQSQGRTLTSEISRINDQISITQLQVKNTESKLTRLADDINEVTEKITKIQSALNGVSEVLANRISKTYIANRSDPVMYLLSSADFNDFIERMEYLRIVQKHDKELLYEMSATQKNYNDQKALLEEKKIEVEKLSSDLKSYKTSLDSQNQEKQNLLTVTKNDERRYQALLAQAQAQLAAFSGFVSSQGGASLLSGQTSCNDWGCYYNQRDSSWGTMRIGLSSDSMAEFGCLVTSSAMVLSHYGHRVTPAQVAQNTNAFFLNTALMNLAPWSIDGVTFTRSGAGTGAIDGELSQGRPVIVGVGAGPSHYVVIKAKDGDQYIMNDPFVENGHDIKFTDHYSLGSISAVNIVRVN